MNRNAITGLTALPLLAASAAQAADNRQNVLYIMTDQQSYYMISAITEALGNDPYARNPYFKTPNLDRLVRSGYTFSNCYAGHPVSGPSRFALLTGEAPNSFGMTGNFSPGGEAGERMLETIEARAMGSLFRKAGYVTCYAGKVHLPWANGHSGKGSIYEPPYRYGFDEYLIKKDRDEMAEKGAEFISGYKGDKPFLLFLSFMNPHDICMAQLLFNDKQLSDFKADEIEMWARENQLRWRNVYRSIDPAAFDGDELARLPFNTAETDRFPAVKLKRPYGNDYRKTRAHIWFYYRLMEQVDKEIGVVLDALEASPCKDNTIVVFTSDHGEMAGSHGAVGKNLPYQECQKVPFIFAGKGIRQGVIDNTTPVCNGWDLLPTLLDLAGLEIPKELNGVSLANTLRTGAPVNRQYLYYETVNSYGILDGGRYKYTRFGLPEDGVNGVESLFDLRNDPGELHNLAGDKAYAAKLDELRKVLKVEMARFGTSWEVLDRSRDNSKSKNK